MSRASPHWTLTRYLIEERRRFPHATGNLNALILDVSIACKAVARIVAQGLLAQGDGTVDDGTAGHIDADHDARQSLDARSNEAFCRMNEWHGHLAGMASQAMEMPRQIPAPHPRGKYLLVFDPLDGASNIDVNVSVGSIFSILRASDETVAAKRDVTAVDFLKLGTSQVAAGYALYGPTTMLVLTVGNGVAGFTLDPTLGEFMLTHPGMTIPPDTQEFAIDSSNARFWEPPVKRYVDECLAGRTGPRGKDFNMRWIASTVAEAHRILMRGGVFLHPHDTRDAQEAGRSHLLHEANPIGFVIEQAGGRASTGRQHVLSVEPTGLHQEVGLVFGSRNEVERIERYHAEPDDTDAPSPLFAERGLFRA